MRNRKARARMIPRPLVIAIAAIGCSGAAHALDLETGNPDLRVRWDNTLRYNLGVRVGSPGTVGNNPAFDEGEYKFGRGEVVTNRIDLLSEVDVTYRERFGLRVSAAGWGDHAYRSANAVRNPGLPAAVPGSYVGDQYSDYTKRFYRGPSGEILDAFVFGKFDLGETPLNVKLGRHTIFWGESLLLNGALHGVSYSQMPLDLAKGFATPGADAKELFRPLNNVSAQLVPSDTLTVAAQYFFDWESYRYPEGGTYLGPADFGFYGPQRQLVSATLGVASNAGAPQPKKRGDWGINARWSPDWLDGTVGFYYRNYTDKLLALYLSGAPRSLQYKQNYAEDVDLFGISLAKQMAGVSFGSELSYRKNTPLTAQTLGFATSPVPALAPVLFPNGAPSLIGNSFQARGNTWHAVFNALGVLPKSALFDTASWLVEMTYSRLDKVTANKDMFYGEGFGVCDASRRAILNAAGNLYRDKWDGCATKNMVGVSVNLTPTWFQVIPGVDLSMPVTFSKTLRGNAPTQLGGSQGNGTYSIGLGVDVDQKYRFDLRYVDFFGKAKEGPGVLPGTTMVTSINGLSTLLKDRGFLAFTFKTTF